MAFISRKDVTVVATVATFLTALVMVVALTGWAWRAWRSRKSAPAATPSTPSPSGKLKEATMPGRKPAEADAVTARLINAVNHDMRSLELGRWFFAQMRARAAASATMCDRQTGTLDFADIARKVPGANAVTQAEVQTHLRDLARQICSLATSTGVSAERAASQLEAVVFGAKDGILGGMPGYAAASPVALPR